MASAHESGEENSSGEESSSDLSESELDFSDESDSDEQSDVEVACQGYDREPCKFYNRGRCQDGQRCPNLHVCKYALRGNCRNGSKCKLKHPKGGRSSSGARNRASDRSASSGSRLTDGRFYQWQLNDGNGWMDIANDHVIEAQYSLPHTKSIKIYNTQYGAVCIDFNKMRVPGKRLRVRRLDDGNTMWIWYCTLRRKWIKYGDKDSKGRPTPAKSSDIEKKFQSNPRGSFYFSAGAKTFEIKFRDMRQVSRKRNRKVTRRPQFRQQAGSGVFQAAPPFFPNLSGRPQWQFEGTRGSWYEYKRRRGTPTECSIISDDIEKNYQQNPRGSMTFQVNGQSYKLDFGAMTQTNLSNNHSRNIRRVLV